MVKLNKKNNQSGAVSLFVVIFTALLITVVTVSFIRIMVSDQQQATASDLAQSAYDSAQAGVEDGKRAILKLQSICNSGISTDCAQGAITVTSNTCNSATGWLGDIAGSGNKSDSEVKIATGGSNKLDQAYTCLKIKTDTDDYLGSLGVDDNKLIPLVGLDDFNKIKIEWFNNKDLDSNITSINVPNSSNGTPLPSKDSWTNPSSPNRPAIMRAQLIQFDSSFSVNDFETNSGSSSLFLYPSNKINTNISFIDNTRKTATVKPTQIHCEDNLSASNYACSATISLPATVLAGSHNTYLNLESLYKNSNFRITLLNSSGGPVRFNGIQSIIDSTGRANDYFKRVSVRVEMTDINFPYPTMAVDTTGNICKDFIVTDSIGDYLNNCSP